MHFKCLLYGFHNYNAWLERCDDLCTVEYSDRASTLEPAPGLLVGSALRANAPDLSTDQGVVINQPDVGGAACCACGCRQTCRTCPDDEDLETQALHVVTTLMPSSQRVWQLKQCALSLIVTRHSKQIPMQQSGARGSPLTE